MLNGADVPKSALKSDSDVGFVETDGTSQDPKSEILEPTQTEQDDFKLPVIEEAAVAGKRGNSEISSITPDKDGETNIEEPRPSVVLPEGSGEAELTASEEQTTDKTVAEGVSSEVHEVSSYSPPPVTDNKELGHSEEIQEITTGSDTPNITIQPATPGLSTIDKEFTPKPLDEAKTTAIEEENGRAQVKSRKQAKPPSSERPESPSSLLSTTREPKPKNFLKAFWQVIFVDWIGGLIRALCGGGRGAYTLLAVGVITLALYSGFFGSPLNLSG